MLALTLPCLAPRAVAQARGEVELWTFSANLRESFTDNIFFNSVAEQGEFITAATLSLAYNRERQDSSLGAFAWGNGQLFGRNDAYNQAQYGLGLSGRKDFNRRFKWRYYGSYADGLNLEALFSGGPAPPQLDIKSAILSTGTSFSLTPRTSWNTSVDGTYLRYRTRIPLDSASLPFDPLAPPDVTGATQETPPLPGALVLPDGVEILRLLSGETILRNSFDYWTWRLGTGFSHSFSPKTRGNVDFGYRFSHQSPRTFSGGNQYEGSLGFGRVLSTSSNLSGGYAYQVSNYGLRSVTHNFTLQADKEFNTKWRGDLTLGATRFDGATPDADGWTWIGGFGVSGRFDRGSLVARYNRSMYQGQIVSTLQVSDAFSLGGGHAFTKRIFGSAFGYYRLADDVIDPRLSYDSAFVSATLSVRFAKRLNGGLSYSFQHFERGASPSLSRSFFSLFFGYSKSWK